MTKNSTWKTRSSAVAQTRLGRESGWVPFVRFVSLEYTSLSVPVARTGLAESRCTCADEKRLLRASLFNLRCRLNSTFRLKLSALAIFLSFRFRTIFFFFFFIFHVFSDGRSLLVDGETTAR